MNSNVLLIAMSLLLGSVVSVSSEGRLPTLPPPTPQIKVAKPQITYLRKFERLGSDGNLYVEYDFRLNNAKDYRELAKTTNSCGTGLVLNIYNARTGHYIYGHCVVNRKVLRIMGKRGFWFARMKNEDPVREFVIEIVDIPSGKSAISNVTLTDEN